MEEINLRVETLKFASHVRETQSPSYFVPEAQRIAGQEVALEEILSFLDNVHDRFPPRDDPRSTYFNLLPISFASANVDGIGKSEAYAKACILLIGHADLFCQFERLLHDDRVDNWRVHVRGKFMREIGMLVGRCRLTMEAIREGARENLTGDHLDCIERLFLAELDGGEEAGGASGAE